jgi:hypothetical protein
MHFGFIEYELRTDSFLVPVRMGRGLSGLRVLCFVAD